MVGVLFAQEENADSLLLKLELQNDTSRINTLLDLSEYYQSDQLDEAIAFGEQALKEANEIEWESGMANSHLVLGSAFDDIGNYSESQFHYFEALKFYEENDFPELLAKAYNGIGIVFEETGNNKNAIKYYSLSMEICEKEALTELYTKVCNNIGLALSQSGEDAKAIEILKEGINTLSLINADTSEYASLFTNIGSAYSYIDELDSAFYYTNMAKEIYLEQDDLENLGRCYLNMGWFYESNKEYEEAIHLYKEGLDYIGGSNEYEDLRILNMSLMLCYSIIGETDSMDTYFESYYQANEDYIANITDKAIQEYEIKYDTEKKEQALVVSQHENEKIGLENELKQNTIYILIGILLIVTLIVVIFYILNQQEQKVTQMEVAAKNNEIESLIQNQELKTYSAQMDGQTKERKRVADDLHDRVGGLLATINLQLEGIEDSKKEQISKVRDLVNESIQEVRIISHNLADGRVDQMGLKQALENLKASLLDNGKVQFDLYLDNYPQDIDIVKEKELYKILLELLSNTLKHAKAKHIVLQTNVIDEMLNITFEDNGIGFDYSKAKHGLGMKTIAKRVEKLNGTWYIDSKIGHGSTIVIDIPSS